MVTKPTVLIVGAGGSASFGFPSGMGLVDMVLNDIESAQNLRGRTLEHIRSIRMISPLEEILHGNHELMTQAICFADGLRRSGSYSLDAFVETRTEFLEVCKLAIAAKLIPLENDLALFPRQLHPTREVGDWYRYLSNRLLSNLSNGSRERLTILTYNYDRSLEHYLHIALANAFGLDETVDHPQLSALEVIHLHGSLGRLPWQNDSHLIYSRSYQSNCDLDAIRMAAAQIKIIHENQDDTPEYRVALDRLNNAARVCFIGFGFHRTNVRRLIKNKWPHAAEPFGTKVVRGSSHGMTEAERIMYQNSFGLISKRNQQEFGINRAALFKLCAVGYKGLDFLRNNVEIVS